MNPPFRVISFHSKLILVSLSLILASVALWEEGASFPDSGDLRYVKTARRSRRLFSASWFPNVGPALTGANA